MISRKAIFKEVYSQKMTEQDALNLLLNEAGEASSSGIKVEENFEELVKINADFPTTILRATWEAS